MKASLLLAVGLLINFSSALGQTKIEAESFIDYVTKDSIKVENGVSVGYFDGAGEQLIYEINVKETGFYQFSSSYVAVGSAIFHSESSHLYADQSQFDITPVVPGIERLPSETVEPTVQFSIPSTDVRSSV